MRPWSLPALLVAAVLAAGCGATEGTEDSSERFRGQQRLVANAVEDLQSAADDDAPGKICRDLLARSLADRLATGAAGCTARVRQLLRDTDTNELDVRSVQVTGDRATARVRQEIGERDRVTEVELVRERNGWRIAEL